MPETCEYIFMSRLFEVEMGQQKMPTHTPTLSCLKGTLVVLCNGRLQQGFDVHFYHMFFLLPSSSVCILTNPVPVSPFRLPLPFICSLCQHVFMLVPRTHRMTPTWMTCTRSKSQTRMSEQTHYFPFKPFINITALLLSKGIYTVLWTNL